MINPFLNSDEQRLRAFFRVVLFLTLFIPLAIIPSFIPIDWLEYLIRSVLVCGLFFVMLKYVDLRPWHEGGLIFNKQWMHECAAGIVIAGIVMALIFVVVLYTGGLTITGFGWQQKEGVYWLLPILNLMIMMISVGFYEEVVARGYILRNFAEGFTIGSVTPKKGAIIAVLVSSAIFGLGHAWNPNVTVFAILNILFAGVMLAVPFIITGRLAYSIGLHFAWNFFQGGIFGFRISGMSFNAPLIQIHQSGPEWWTGGSFGPEGGLIGLIGVILIFFLVLAYIKLSGIPLKFSTTFSKKFTEKIEI